MAFREARRPSTLPAHNREHTSMAAHNPVALLLLPMNVQSSSACSSMISTSRNIRWLKRFAAVEARSSHRAMVWRAWPVTRAVAELLTPSTRRLATWSHSLRAQRRPLYAVPVCVLTVPPQTVQRYRQRRPHFVGNDPGPTMLRPSFPRLSHPRLAQAIPSIACIAQVVPGGNQRFSPKISEVKATDQQRPAQAPDHNSVGVGRLPRTSGRFSYSRRRSWHGCGFCAPTVPSLTPRRVAKSTFRLSGSGPA